MGDFLVADACFWTYEVPYAYSMLAQPRSLFGIWFAEFRQFAII